MESIAVMFTNLLYMYFSQRSMKLKPIIERKTTRLRDVISVEQWCVWCLAMNVEYRTAAHLFGVSRLTVCLIVNSVCLHIVELLMPTCIYSTSKE